MTEKVGKYVLPNLPYLLLLWFFTKLGEVLRVSYSGDILHTLIRSVDNFRRVFADPIPSATAFDWLVGVGVTVTIFVTIVVRKRYGKKWRRDVEYGSARFGTKKDIAPYVDPKPDNNIILTATESLTMNSRPKNPKYARNKNVLVVGGSGSGKTRFWLKPNLMQMHSSYVVTDPKGTILIETGKMLQRNGYQIKVLNTIDFNKSMHYNPFNYITSEKDILKFVTALIANTKGEGKAGDDFWVKAETLLYCALIGYIHYEAEADERNMNTLVEMINAMEVREDDESFKNAIDYLFEELAEKDENHFAVRQYAKYKLAAGVVS